MNPEKRKKFTKILSTISELRDEQALIKTLTLQSFTKFRDAFFNDILLLFMDRQKNLVARINFLEKEYGLLYKKYQFTNKMNKKFPGREHVLQKNVNHPSSLKFRVNKPLPKVPSKKKRTGIDQTKIKKEIERKNQELEEKKNDLKKRIDEVDNREYEISKKEKMIERKLKDIREKENKILLQRLRAEKQLSKKQEEISRKSVELVSLQQRFELEEKTYDLYLKEKEIKRRVENLKTKERQLILKNERLREKKKEIEEELNEKIMELEEEKKYELKAKDDQIFDLEKKITELTREEIKKDLGTYMEGLYGNMPTKNKNVPKTKTTITKRYSTRTPISEEEFLKMSNTGNSSPITITTTKRSIPSSPVKKKVVKRVIKRRIGQNGKVETTVIENPKKASPKARRVVKKKVIKKKVVKKPPQSLEGLSMEERIKAQRESFFNSF